MSDFFPFDKDLEVESSCGHVTALDKHTGFGELALVAIGNPIVDRDAAAIELLRRFRRNNQSQRICCLNLEMSFGWLSKILKTHRSVIILDPAVMEKEETESFVVIPLNKETLSKSGFPIKLSHGLGWIDEVKLVMLEDLMPDNLIFFGVIRHNALEESLLALNKTIDGLLSGSQFEVRHA